MRLTTERLELKSWRRNDAREFHAIWGDPKVIWWGASQNLNESQSRLNTILDETAKWLPGCGWYAVRNRTGVIIGNVMLQPARCLSNETEIGWHFIHRYQGKGYATEAAKTLLCAGFKRLDIERIIAPIVPTNVAAQRVASKLGMKPIRQIQYAGYQHNLWAIERS